MSTLLIGKDCSDWSGWWVSPLYHGDINNFMTEETVGCIENKMGHRLLLFMMNRSSKRIRSLWTSCCHEKMIQPN